MGNEPSERVRIGTDFRTRGSGEPGWSSLFALARREASLRRLGLALGAGDRRGAIREIIDGRRGAKSARYAWEVGARLRDVAQIPWASGTLALFAGNFLPEFVCALADMARRGYEVDAVITALLAQTFIDDSAEAEPLRARVLELAPATAYAQRYDARLLRGTRRDGRRADRAFRFAYVVAREEEDFDDALRGAILQVVDWALYRATADTRSAALTCIALRDQYLRCGALPRHLRREAERDAQDRAALKSGFLQQFSISQATESTVADPQTKEGRA